MLGYVLGGCIAVYVVAVLFRWLVKLYTKVSGREFTSYKVRYATIGFATFIAFLLSGFGEGSFNSPDYSYSWAYAVSGLIVFSMSVGRSYWTWRRAMRAADSPASQNARMSEMGLVGRVGSMFTQDAEEEGEYEEWEEDAGDQNNWNDSRRSPSTFASRFRVEESNEGLVLVNKKDSEDTARVRRTAVLFSMSCVPESLGESVTPNGERVVQLTDSQLDTTIFGIDGDGLRPLELNAVHVYPLAAYGERNPLEDPDEGAEQRERDANQVPGCLYFFPGDWESDDYVGMEVGLPEPRFTRLFEGCEAGGVERVHFRGYFGGHTASYFYEDRPFILLSREIARINFDSVSVTSPAGGA